MVLNVYHPLTNILFLNQLLPVSTELLTKMAFTFIEYVFIGFLLHACRLITAAGDTKQDAKTGDDVTVSPSTAPQTTTPKHYIFGITDFMTNIWVIVGLIFGAVLIVSLFLWVCCYCICNREQFARHDACCWCLCCCPDLSGGDEGVDADKNDEKEDSTNKHQTTPCSHHSSQCNLMQHGCIGCHHQPYGGHMCPPQNIYAMPVLRPPQFYGPPNHPQPTAYENPYAVPYAMCRF